MKAMSVDGQTLDSYSSEPAQSVGHGGANKHGTTISKGGQ